MNAIDRLRLDRALQGGLHMRLRAFFSNSKPHRVYLVRYENPNFLPYYHSGVRASLPVFRCEGDFGWSMFGTCFLGWRGSGS